MRTTRRVAILVDDQFEDPELFGPRELLAAAGLDVVLVGPFGNREYTGRAGGVVRTDVAAYAARAEGFDAILIPGGGAPDRLRIRHAIVDLARAALAAGKPVAAIGHGPQVLISANALRGRTLTCWPSIAVDVKNAGGAYVDRPVVIDGSLITARKALDVPAFVAAILERLDASR